MFAFPLTQKKLPAGGIPAILRGAFSNDSAPNAYLRRRRAAKPAKANKLNVAVVGSGISRILAVHILTTYAC